MFYSKNLTSFLLSPTTSYPHGVFHPVTLAASAVYPVYVEVCQSLPSHLYLNPQGYARAPLTFLLICDQLDQVYWILIVNSKGERR